MSEHKLINQDKYVGIERSQWKHPDIMPLKGWAETISGKFSPHKPTEMETHTLENNTFPRVTRFGKNFAQPIVCMGRIATKDGRILSCGKGDACKLIEQGLQDLCKFGIATKTLVTPHHMRIKESWVPRILIKSTRRSVWLDDHEENWVPDKEGVLSFYRDPRLISETALKSDMDLDTATDDMNAGEIFTGASNELSGDEEVDLEEAANRRADKALADSNKTKIINGISWVKTYKWIHKDVQLQHGGEIISRTKEQTYVRKTRKWIYQSSGFTYTEIPEVVTTKFREDLVKPKWISYPTLRATSCKIGKFNVVHSETVVTKSENKHYSDMREVERMKKAMLNFEIKMDELENKKIPLAALVPQ